MLQTPYANTSVAYCPCHLTDSTNPVCLMGKYFLQCFCLWLQITTTGYFLLQKEKYCRNYFAFNQSYLAKGRIARAVLLPHEAK